jgi:hypothetical protein
MNQNRSRNQDVPNRESEMEQAEGSRENIRNSGEGVTSRQSPGSKSERGRGSDGERNRMDSDSSSRSSNSGGITNRPLDREQCEQQQLPDRGRSQSER